MFHPRLIFALCLSLIAGCAVPAEQPSAEHEGVAQLSLDLRFDHTAIRAMLRVVNDPGSSLDYLDIDLGLDRRAAAGIVAHRQGPDGQDGGWDDDRFDSLAELDGVAWVGPVTLRLLAQAAEDLDLVPVLEIEGVAFSQTELDATLQLVNAVNEQTLDREIGLDSRAARAIVAGQPYLDLPSLGERPWVGPVALRDLRAFALLQRDIEA